MLNRVENFEWEYEDIDLQYELQTIDELQSVSDPIRYRMVLLLREKAMTGAQLARALNLNRQVGHYHLKQLIDTGLVEFKGEKIENGMVGKYYRAKANFFTLESLISKYASGQSNRDETRKFFKAISDNAFTMLDISFQDFEKSEDFFGGNFLSIETDMTEEQSSSIRNEIEALRNHLLEIKNENFLNKGRNTSLHYRITLFFTPSPHEPAE